MAPLPKRKISHHRQGRRRAAISLNLTQTHPCPKCGSPKRPHQACRECGYYGPKRTTSE